MHRQNQAEPGFTLLEILVALVVLGFLIAGLTQGTRFGLQAWGMQTRIVTRQSDMDDVYRVLRAMVEAADPGEINQLGTFQGAAHTLTLLTRLPLAAAPSGLLDADVALGVDDRHRLVARAVAHPHAERVGPAPAALQSTLLEGVDHVDFSYYRVAPKPAGWTNVWRDQDPPALVRLHIAFTKDDKRNWPDLVAATIRSRLEE